LIVRLARENPRRGYQRIVGELKGVSVVVSATNVKKISVPKDSARRFGAGRHGEGSSVCKPTASLRWIS